MTEKNPPTVFQFGIDPRGESGSLPPSMQMFLLSQGTSISRAVAMAADLRIADLLANGPLGSDELAAATSTHADSLYRMLRMLTAVGVFAELDGHRFTQTPLSELLRGETPGSLRSWMRMVALPAWSPMFAEAMHSIATGEPCFARAKGVEFFDYLAAHPAEAVIFQEAMADFGGAVDEAVVETYDFAGIQTVVDVGGGHGSLMAAILRAHPRLDGVLHDLPHVVDGAARTLRDAGVADRCQLDGGDFFEEVPAGGDAYFLKWIVHDWDRDRAAAILQSCRRAMPSGGRLVLIEAVLPGPDEPHPGKLLDFLMLLGLGGRERTAEQYADLLRETGFELTRVLPTRSPMSIVEAVPTAAATAPAGRSPDRGR